MVAYERFGSSVNIRLLVVRLSVSLLDMRTCGVCSARKVKIGKLKVKILCGIWIHPKHPLYEKKKKLKSHRSEFRPDTIHFRMIPLDFSRLH